jgi:hypothetical protein
LAAKFYYPFSRRGKVGKHSAELPNDKVASHTKRMCITFHKDEIKAKIVLRKRYQKSSDLFSFYNKEM